jgi:hypothetical protein
VVEFLLLSRKGFEYFVEGALGVQLLLSLLSEADFDSLHEVLVFGTRHF